MSIYLNGFDSGQKKHWPDAADFARDCAGFHPDALQERVLRATGRRVMVKASRMWGKSTVAAMKALHAARCRPEGEVVVVCAGKAEAARMTEFIERQREHLWIRCGITVTAGVAQKFGRVALAVIDDAASVKDEVYEALRPAVAAARGTLWMLSTPRGQKGFFYEAWKQGQKKAGRRDEWLRVSAPAEQCERLPPEFLEEERAELGEVRFATEYGCEFEGEAKAKFILEYVNGSGEIYARYGQYVDWSAERDGPWEEFQKAKNWPQMNADEHR